MKKLLLASAGLCALALPAKADDQSIIPGKFSTTIGFTSEYSFRGIAQSNEHPAVQGSIDWTQSDDGGFYAGVWGSSIDFADASLETDLYAGYSGKVDKFNYDIGGIYYLYPGTNGSEDFNYAEAALALGYDFDVFSVSGALNYSPDYFAGSGDSLYSAAYVDVPLPFLPFETALHGNFGHSEIQKNARFGTKDYSDWGIGISSKIEGFDVSVKWIDTDLDEPSECADGCDGRIIAAISKTFP